MSIRRGRSASLSARPLALADWLGVKDCHEMLVQMQSITGNDRYRPSQWLRRWAQLGLSATTVQ